MRILTILLYIALAAFMVLAFTACDDSDDGSTSIPWDPTDEMLNDGPGEGAEFVHWSDYGLNIADSLGTSVTGWCGDADTTHLEIPCMVGLYTYPASFDEDSLQCTIELADNDYAQLEYHPDGYVFDEPVQLWLDTNVVNLPAGTTAADIVFYYYNRETGEFEALETTLEEDWWIVWTNHFSRYVLGKRVSAN